jgi:Ser/Thr protein kinase RdoA (MazF antagonist)
VVIDFEIARLDWRIVDIIDGCAAFCVHRTGNTVAKMKCFLDAYQSHMPLTADEIKLIPEVSKFFQITSCIRYWYTYSMTGNRVFLVKARKCVSDLQQFEKRYYAISKTLI